MTSSVNSPSILAELATKATALEFLGLTRTATNMLANENGAVGNVNVTGRLVEVPAAGEAIIVGDLHGDLESLVYILEESNFMANAKHGRDVLLIFLGDYGDRGSQSPEVYYVVLKLKETYPRNVILMRGNHEGPPDLIASPHDLAVHLKNRFGKRGSAAYLQLCGLFNHLYTAVLIEGRVVLFHGGVPSQAKTVRDIVYAHEKHPREQHLEEILWNDPWEGIQGTIASPRGVGRIFGEDVTDKLLKMLNVKALIRGHECCAEGYKTSHNQKVLTLFSRKGAPYPNRCGAYLHLDLSMELQKPKQLLDAVRKF